MALSRAPKRPIVSLLNSAIGGRCHHSFSRASGAPGGRPLHRVAGFDPSRLPCGGGGLLSSRWYSGDASPADNMSLIRQLRERTSAPIKDVKSALISCDWDLGRVSKFGSFLFLFGFSFFASSLGLILCRCCAERVEEERGCVGVEEVGADCGRRSPCVGSERKQGFCG